MSSKDNIVFIDDYFLRLVTLVMLYPREFIPRGLYNKNTLLTLNDYEDNDINQLTLYALEMYKLNKRFLSKDFVIGNREELVNTYGVNNGISLERQKIDEIINKLCSARDSFRKGEILLGDNLKYYTDRPFKDVYDECEKKTSDLDCYQIIWAVRNFKKLFAVLRTLFPDWQCD